MRRRRPGDGRGDRTIGLKIEIDDRTFWRLAAACVAVLVPLNWSWYEWGRQLPASHALYLLAGTAVYFVLLRWIAGIRFTDLSRAARFVVVSSIVLLIVFLGWYQAQVPFREELLRHPANGSEHRQAADLLYGFPQNALMPIPCYLIQDDATDRHLGIKALAAEHECRHLGLAQAQRLQAALRNPQ